MDKPLSGCKESCCSLQRLYDSHPPALEYLNWQGWIYFTLVLDATCRRFRFFEGSEETLLALLTVHVRWFILSGPEVRFWIMQKLLRWQGCIFYFCVKCICRRFYFLWRLWFGDAGCWRWCLCLYGGQYFLGQRWNLIVSLCWRFRGGLLVHVFELFCMFIAGYYSSFAMRWWGWKGWATSNGSMKFYKPEVGARGVLWSQGIYKSKLGSSRSSVWNWCLQQYFVLLLGYFICNLCWFWAIGHVFVMAFSRHGKEVKRTRFFTPAVCEFFAIVSSLSLFSRLCILAVGEDRFPSGWCPGSIYENKCGKEIVYIAYMLWRSAEEIHISWRAKRPGNQTVC